MQRSPGRGPTTRAASRSDSAAPMQFVLLQAAIGLLCVSVLLLLLLWIYRFVQYRRAVQLSHARWLHYEPGLVVADEDQCSGIPWPSAKPIMLSPIPEERFESGPVHEPCGCETGQCCGLISLLTQESVDSESYKERRNSLTITLLSCTRIVSLVHWLHTHAFCIQMAVLTSERIEQLPVATCKTS